MAWIDRFGALSPEERAMTVAEDPSTLTALVNEARLMQDWYRRWRLARESNPPTQPADLKGPAGGALVGQMEPAKSTSILIGDVVLVGGRMEPPQFHLVTTDYERWRWHTRRDEITTVFRPAESTGPYLCACTCGCVDRTIRPGRCMVCRVRESCLKDEQICEACESGYRLASDGIHYDHNDSTWGVCRKVIASVRMDRESKRQRSENP